MWNTGGYKIACVGAYEYGYTVGGLDINFLIVS